MWWSIIKNQIASTKGKTFQLDFNQPMIEEEDNCKERLNKMIDALTKINAIDYLIEPTEKRKLTLEDFEEDKGSDWYYYVGKESYLQSRNNYFNIQFHNHLYQPFDNIKEEEACIILDMLKKEIFTEEYVSTSPDVYIMEYIINELLLFPDKEQLDRMKSGFYVFVVTVDLSEYDDPSINPQDICDFNRLINDIKRIISNA